MSSLKGILRSLSPGSIRRKVREAREVKIWHDLDLCRELAGLKVKVSSKADWTVFNEIFVEGFYDRAIGHALSHVPMDQPLHVLDLGANVGFFAMRFSQLVFQSDHPDRPFFIHSVEGSPRVYADLSARISSNPRLKGHVETRHGLVGTTAGSADIYESSFGAGNSTTPQFWSKPVTVSYINLDSLIPADIPIALLKCDIEGSEQTFQDNYHNLLLRTEAAVIELHHRLVDPEKFHEGMRTLGFTYREILWESEQEQASLILYRH
jgi:FkbM family methyltransferase